MRQNLWTRAVSEGDETGTRGAPERADWLAGADRTEHHLEGIAGWSFRGSVLLRTAVATVFKVKGSEEKFQTNEFYV